MKHIGIGDAARQLRVSQSRLSRVFSDGRHSEPPRLAGKRAIPVTWLPRLARLLCVDAPSREDVSTSAEKAEAST